MKTFLIISLFLSLPIIAASATKTPEKQACFEMNPQACTAFYETNRQRVQNHLPALTFCHECFRMAQDQSDDMFKRHYFSHDRPSFRDRRAEPFPRRAHRFGLENIGENIAFGTSGLDSVKAWMESPPHRKNILNSQFRSFAVGYKGNFATEVFSTDAEEAPAAPNYEEPETMEANGDWFFNCHKRS
jgi:uncharacterized protein YkwD